MERGRKGGRERDRGGGGEEEREREGGRQRWESSLDEFEVMIVVNLLRLRDI